MKTAMRLLMIGLLAACFSQGWAGTYQWQDATTLEFAINGGNSSATLTSIGLIWAWGGHTNVRAHLINVQFGIKASKL